jgi:hypothetical protein
MHTDYSENSYDECRTYIEDLQQRLAGRSVPEPELIDLFTGLLRQMMGVYSVYLADASVQEFSSWSDEDLIAGVVYLTSLQRYSGMHHEGWIGAEVFRDKREHLTFAIDFTIEELIGLYLQKGRDLESVTIFIECSMNWAFVRADLARRMEPAPIQGRPMGEEERAWRIARQEHGRAILQCLLSGDNQALRRLKKALDWKLWWLGDQRRPEEWVDKIKDQHSVAIGKTWHTVAESWAKIHATPVGPARVPLSFLEEEEGWRKVTAKLSPRVRLAQNMLLPIIRGEAERYLSQAQQAIRNHRQKQVTEKRGGRPPRLVPPIDPGCPFCHRGIGQPARPHNPDSRVWATWPFTCNQCGVAFDGKPEWANREISWGEYFRSYIPRTNAEPFLQKNARAVEQSSLD